MTTERARMMRRGSEKERDGAMSPPLIALSLSISRPRETRTFPFSFSPPSIFVASLSLFLDTLTLRIEGERKRERNARGSGQETTCTRRDETCQASAHFGVRGLRKRNKRSRTGANETRTAMTRTATTTTTTMMILMMMIHDDDDDDDKYVRCRERHSRFYDPSAREGYCPKCASVLALTLIARKLPSKIRHVPLPPESSLSRDGLASPRGETAVRFLPYTYAHRRHTAPDYIGTTTLFTYSPHDFSTNKVPSTMKFFYGAPGFVVGCAPVTAHVRSLRAPRRGVLRSRREPWPPWRARFDYGYGNLRGFSLRVLSI